MSDFILDWICLFIQILMLLVIVVRELIQSRNRNLYAIFISVTILVLVQGQSWWLLSQFEKGSSNIVHLYQFVSLESTRLANLYTGLFTVTLAITYTCYTWISRSKSKKSLLLKPDIVVLKIEHNNSTLSDIVILTWVVLFGIILVVLLGGLQEAIDSPGNSVGGQTVLLIAVSLGKIPLLKKLALKQRPKILDILIFGFTFLLTLINSRFLATFMLVQVMLIFNYCWKQIPRRWIISSSFIFIFIFIIYGLYRDNSVTNYGLDLFERLKGVSNRFDVGESAVDWFYRTNVEGFVGLAGILTYENQVGGINHDFGLSNLTIFVQLIPNAIRNDQYLVAPLANFLRSLYPYPEGKGSVVSPGLETAYAHFGLFGIIFLGFSLGYLAYFLHRMMLEQKQDRLLLGLLSIHSVNIVRTMFSYVLFFGLADWIILLVYRIILNFGKKQDKRADSKSY